MKRRGEFDLGVDFSPTPSAERLIEAECDWRESWEPSVPQTHTRLGSAYSTRQLAVVQIEIGSMVVRVICRRSAA